MAYKNNAFTLNEEKKRFEMKVDDAIAFIAFTQAGNTLNLTHTETPPALEGKGIATALAEKAMQYISNHHLQMIPTCPFVQAYLQKHPEWNRLVAKQ